MNEYPSPPLQGLSQKSRDFCYLEPSGPWGPAHPPCPPLALGCCQAQAHWGRTGNHLAERLSPTLNKRGKRRPQSFPLSSPGPQILSDASSPSPGPRDPSRGGSYAGRG